MTRLAMYAIFAQILLAAALTRYGETWGLLIYMAVCMAPFLNQPLPLSATIQASIILWLLWFMFDLFVGPFRRGRLLADWSEREVTLWAMTVVCILGLSSGSMGRVRQE